MTFSTLFFHFLLTASASKIILPLEQQALYISVAPILETLYSHPPLSELSNSRFVTFESAWRSFIDSGSFEVLIPNYNSIEFLETSGAAFEELLEAFTAFVSEPCMKSALPSSLHSQYDRFFADELPIDFISSKDAHTLSFKFPPLVPRSEPETMRSVALNLLRAGESYPDLWWRELGPVQAEVLDEKGRYIFIGDGRNVVADRYFDLVRKCSVRAKYFDSQIVQASPHESEHHLPLVFPSLQTVIFREGRLLHMHRRNESPMVLVPDDELHNFRMPLVDVSENRNSILVTLTPIADPEAGNLALTDNHRVLRDHPQPDGSRKAFVLVSEEEISFPVSPSDSQSASPSGSCIVKRDVRGIHWGTTAGKLSVTRSLSPEDDSPVFSLFSY